MNKTIGSEIRTTEYLGPQIMPSTVPEEIDLIGLTYAAMRETLVSPNIPMVFKNLFLSLLTEKSDKLIWKRGGVGENTELKRGYSAIFGRIFARYFLTEKADVKCLLPIQSKIPVSSYPFELEIKNKNPNLPDWIGCTEKELILAEAKGSHDLENWQKKSYPKNLPSRLETAKQQVNSSHISLYYRDKLKHTFAKIPFTGWSVASRWATENKNNEPWLGASIQKPKKLSHKRNIAELALYYLNQFCVIMALRTSGHFGNDALNWLYTKDYRRTDFPLQTYLAKCTHKISINDKSLKGVFAIFGPFGFIPIRRKINLVQIKAFIRDFKDNEVYLVMIDHKLVNSINWHNLGRNPWENFENLVNIIPADDSTDFDLFDLGLELENQKFLFELNIYGEELHFEPVSSNVIYMRNGIAMIDPKATKIID